MIEAQSPTPGLLDGTPSSHKSSSHLQILFNFVWLSLAILGRILKFNLNYCSFASAVWKISFFLSQFPEIFIEVSLQGCDLEPFHYDKIVNVPFAI